MQDAFIVFFRWVHNGFLWIRCKFWHKRYSWLAALLYIYFTYSLPPHRSFYSKYAQKPVHNEELMLSFSYTDPSALVVWYKHEGSADAATTSGSSISSLYIHASSSSASSPPGSGPH